MINVTKIYPISLALGLMEHALKRHVLIMDTLLLHSTKVIVMHGYHHVLSIQGLQLVKPQELVPTIQEEHLIIQLVVLGYLRAL